MKRDLIYLALIVAAITAVKVTARTTPETPAEIRPLRIVRAHQRQRTVFALPKFTMPDGKILVLEIVERNGARHQRIEIRNKMCIRDRCKSGSGASSWKPAVEIR